MLTIQAWLQAQNELPDSDKLDEHQLNLLLEQLLQQNRAWLFTHSDYKLNETQLNQLSNWTQALSSGQPFAYVMGEQMFWDLTLKVNEHTLIPRPDTEIVIETVLELFKKNKPKRILDLGTGSGALALVLASIYPSAEVLAVDQSIDALKVAKENAANNGINNVTFLQSDWFKALPETQFDLIISNPPYIAEDDSHLAALNHEPWEALVADQNGMGDYIRICKSAKNYLVDGGLLVFEHGWQQQQKVLDTLIKSGLRHCGSRQDLAGLDRVSFAYKQT